MSNKIKTCAECRRWRSWVKRWIRVGTGTNIMGETCPDAEVPVVELRAALDGEPPKRGK